MNEGSKYGGDGASTSARGVRQRIVVDLLTLSDSLYSPQDHVGPMTRTFIELDTLMWTVTTVINTEDAAHHLGRARNWKTEGLPCITEFGREGQCDIDQSKKEKIGEHNASSLWS